MTYELFQEGPEVYLPIIILSLLITILAYGAFPLIFAIIRKKEITKKKYQTLCYCINIAIMIFFIAINGDPSSAGPYVLWTSIFTLIGLKILDKKQSSGNYHSSPQSRFCGNCGTKLSGTGEFCPNCGTKLTAHNNKDDIIVS